MLDLLLLLVAAVLGLQGGLLADHVQQEVLHQWLGVRAVRHWCWAWGWKDQLEILVGFECCSAACCLAWLVQQHGDVLQS